MDSRRSQGNAQKPESAREGDAFRLFSYRHPFWMLLSGGQGQNLPVEGGKIQGVLVIIQPHFKAVF